MSRATVRFIIGCFAIFSFVFISSCYEPYDEVYHPVESNIYSYNQSQDTYITTFELMYKDCNATTSSILVQAKSTKGVLLHALLVAENWDIDFKPIECNHSTKDATNTRTFLCNITGSNVQYLTVEHTNPEIPTVVGFYALVK
jgi:hypothetical protein